jgi:hypothetical protein
MFYQFFCSYSYWKITDSVTKNSNTSFSSWADQWHKDNTYRFLKRKLQILDTNIL